MLKSKPSKAPPCRFTYSKHIHSMFTSSSVWSNGIMSAKKDVEVDKMCASCGSTGGSVIGTKLKRCNACKLVQYCSVACQKRHRSQHKRACRKRVAELREELLFKQPEISHMGECPICCLPLPLGSQKTGIHACCSKIVCAGCAHATRLQEEEGLLQNRCPFCRTPCPTTEAEADKYFMKRIEANDPVAICDIAMQQCDEQKYSSALNLFRKAAELGDVESHYQLAFLPMLWQGVDRDEKKEVHHLEEAAIGGHIGARYTLGLFEGKGGRQERGIRHFIIAANLGHDKSMEELKKLFKKGLVKKDILAAALRAHKAAVDATKSPQREAADQFFNALQDGKKEK